MLHVDVPGLAPDPGSPAETLALRLAGKNQTQTVPFGTEAGHFQRRGIPTVVCGPGSIDQAHQPDEYITLDQLEARRRLHAAPRGDLRAFLSPYSHHAILSAASAGSSEHPDAHDCIGLSRDHGQAGDAQRFKTAA